ncbi:MAG: YbfB/YjiJ family MFS transporter, partial [Acidimicrobiia bacterium]|nr:YbfB/YjiJ family MFS transporter [Acidimicrobiia bacterium]
MVSTDRLSRRSVASLLFIAAGAMVSQGFGRFTYPVLLDAIDDDVLHSYERAGLLGTIGVLAYLLGTALMSYASTRAEPVSLVRAGLSLSLICLVLMAIAPGFAILAVGSFLGGLGGAGAWIPSPGLGAAAVGPQRAGLAIGLVGAGIGSGIVVAGPLTNLVRSLSGDEGAWRPVYVIEALIAVVVLAGVLFVVRLPATGTSAERIPVSVIRRVPGWKLLLAAFGLFGFAYSLYFYFLVAQLKEDGWSSSARNWIFTLLGVASVAGGIIFGRISDSHGRPLTMAVGFALLTVSPLLTLSGVAPLVIAAAVSFGLCVSGTPT